MVSFPHTPLLINKELRRKELHLRTIESVDLAWELSDKEETSEKGKSNLLWDLSNKEEISERGILQIGMLAPQGQDSRTMRSSNCLSSNYSLCEARHPSFVRTDQQSASFGEQCRQESIHNRAKRIPFPSRYQAQPICYLFTVHCSLSTDLCSLISVHCSLTSVHSALRSQLNALTDPLYLRRLRFILHRYRL